MSYFTLRWQETWPGEYTSVLGNNVWKLNQSDTHVYYTVYGLENDQCQAYSNKAEKKCKSNESAPVYSAKAPEETAELSEEASRVETTEFSNFLGNYFQLNVKLKDLYETWCLRDPSFKKVSEVFSGVRILRQDPTENLFSFICSSNNNISRIASMVEKLCEHYGKHICRLEGKDYFTFPTVEALASDEVESKLRGLGFGYRAKFIHESARYIVDNHDSQWLHSLRERPYEEAKRELIKLHGVGAKVT